MFMHHFNRTVYQCVCQSFIANRLFGKRTVLLGGMREVHECCSIFIVLIHLQTNPLTGCKPVYTRQGIVTLIWFISPTEGNIRLCLAWYLPCTEQTTRSKQSRYHTCRVEPVAKISNMISVIHLLVMPSRDTFVGCNVVFCQLVGCDLTHGVQNLAFWVHPMHK